MRQPSLLSRPKTGRAVKHRLWCHPSDAALCVARDTSTQPRQPIYSNVWQQLSLEYCCREIPQTEHKLEPKRDMSMCRKPIQLCRAGMFRSYIPKVGSLYLDLVIHYFRHAFQPVHPPRSRLTTSGTNKDNVDACLLRLGHMQQTYEGSFSLHAWRCTPCSPFSIGFLKNRSLSTAS